MDWALFWTAAAVVVAAGGSIVPIVIYRRQNRPRRILYGFSQSDLLNITSDQIQVFFEGKPVGRPYTTLLQVLSDSRADISSGMFDAGESLRFDFGDEIISVSPRIGNELRFTIDGSAVLIAPQLIRKGAGGALTLIQDGRTRACIVTSPLVDVDVESLDGPLGQPTKVNPLTILLLAASGMAVVVAGLLIAGFALNVFQQ